MDVREDREPCSGDEYDRQLGGHLVREDEKGHPLEMEGGRWDQRRRKAEYSVNILLECNYEIYTFSILISTS